MFMKNKKSIFTTLTGGLTSATSILLSCCKSGACIGVCASPISSLFGISSATMANYPIINALEPLLIAVSAVSFTISYYSIYVMPKFNCKTDCACEPDAKEQRKTKINKIIFWLGLVLSVGFLSYFEYAKYQNNTQKTECFESSCCEGLEATSTCSDTTLCEGTTCGS